MGGMPKRLGAALVAAWASAAFAGSAGTISGVVTDAATGEPIAGAFIEVVPEEGPLVRITSDGAGAFTLTVRPGAYSLEVLSNGYRPWPAAGSPFATDGSSARTSRSSRQRRSSSTPAVPGGRRQPRTMPCSRPRSRDPGARFGTASGSRQLLHRPERPLRHRCAGQAGPAPGEGKRPARRHDELSLLRRRSDTEEDHHLPRRERDVDGGTLRVHPEAGSNRRPTRRRRMGFQVTREGVQVDYVSVAVSVLDDSPEGSWRSRSVRGRLAWTRRSGRARSI